MLAGIRAGDFHLSSGDFGVDLLTRAMGGAPSWSQPGQQATHSLSPSLSLSLRAGMSPRANPVLDALLLPLTVAVGVVSAAHACA